MYFQSKVTGVVYIFYQCIVIANGQTISLCVYKDGDTPVTPMAGSLFAVAMVPKDWPGVSATLSNNQLISRQGWNELGGWETGNLANGLFSFDGAFQPVSGRYVVPLEGTYIVSCIININGTVKLPLEVMIAVNDKQRHFSRHCDDTGPHITLHPPPLLRVASDACQAISLHCEAVSNGKITYQWFKNNQLLVEKSPSLVINNARLSDAGRYMCAAESYNVSVTSYPSIVEVFGDTNDIFTLNPSISTSETILTNTSPLDFEQEKEYRLNIKATNADTRQSLDILVTINIEDVNDNYPVFTPQFYATSVPEEAWKGALILQVTTTDVDSGDNRKVTYSITGGNTGGAFDINPANGIVFVNNTLDYESIQSYNLSIEARDLGHPSLQSHGNAHVTIRITDSNDNNPVFSVSAYNFSVAEDSGKGWVVGRVHATDRDKADNGRVIYVIQDTEMLKTFSINQTSGEISLSGEIDYEVTNVYELLVTAVDQGTHPRTGAVLVRISVQDVNDNFPIFDPKAYSVYVTEATIVGTDILRVYAGDKDSGLRGDVRYTITEGDTDGTFRVTARGGIVVNRTLDREHKQRYNLTITATDRGSPPKTSHDPCRVEIHVGDVNDNFPQFLASMYNTTLPENASIGYDVIRVQATDDDIGSNALITYHMDTSCYSSRLANQTLTVNETTGVVYTTQEIDFDTLQDDDKSIRFRVEAKDGGSPSLKSFVEVVVMITDVNDNSPVFMNLPKIVSIRDDTPESETIYTVIAKDRDYGSNAHVRYSIEELKENGVVIPNQDVFGIDANSGRVFATKAFKKEYRTEFELVIQARDLGSPPLSSRSSLSIRVNDANDHKPAFEKPLYKRSFSTPPTTNSLLFTVNASDQDIGNNSVIDYEINLVNATDTCQANFSIASNGTCHVTIIIEPDEANYSSKSTAGSRKEK
ncbi:hypothetical protein QZH41_003165 [Actinostola sp. cb2023]|nr:hypothetical protein QZH41_003165 [Actinostola sp. cb2023]